MSVQVPKGYKQTEVGVIPEDWGVARLSTCLEEAPSYGINAPAVKYDLTLPAYIRITDISEDGRFIESNRASVSHPNYSSYLLSDGNLVFARTGASVGKSYLYNSNDGNLVYAGFLIKIKPNKEKLDSLFLSNYVKTDYYWSWVKTNSMRSGQPGINGSEYGSLPLVLPPLKEQQAIAEALSDADALIESLEQLIAKKRQIKQGAMQELLTGQRRLPGFGGEWIQQRLGDIAHIKTGGRNNQDKVENGEFPFFVRSATVERINTFTYDCEAILVPGEGGIGSIFHYIFGKFDVHQRVYAITQFSGNVSGKFIYYYMKTYFGRHAMENSVKATVDSLRLPTFQDFAVKIPSSVEEQIEIASILSEMEQELEMLEERLQKAQTIKQSMMQELLTGRIRLI